VKRPRGFPSRATVGCTLVWRKRVPQRRPALTNRPRKHTLLFLVLCYLLATTLAAEAEDSQLGDAAVSPPRPVAAIVGSHDQQPDAGMVDEKNAALPFVRPSRSKSMLKHLRSASSFWKLKYYFVAQNDLNCDVFFGLVQDNPLTGVASVDFSFPNGCLCHGKAAVTYYPAFGVAGERGQISATCSDGRTFGGEFTTTSLTTGNGSASDSLGNGYSVTFGHTISQAIQSVNVIRKRLNCPGCQPKDVETEVKGRILRAN
jgi:hypothetical protein